MLVFFAMRAAAAAVAITRHYTAVAVLLDMIAIGYLEQEKGNLSKGSSAVRKKRDEVKC